MVVNKGLAEEAEATIEGMSLESDMVDEGVVRRVGLTYERMSV